MIFLIDYENVNNAGMRGAEFLQPTDTLILFFSKNAHNMEKRYLIDIQNSGCTFETYKLINSQKNGLDFYLATKLGEVFGNPANKSVVIISKDAGFQAVRDFWQCCAKPQRRVFLSESIELGILRANEHDERTDIIRYRLLSTDIGKFFNAYRETLKLRELLQEVFNDTEYINRTDEMEEILKTGKTAKVIYLNTLHCFGRKDGLAVYQRLKNCAKL